MHAQYERMHLVRVSNLRAGKKISEAWMSGGLVHEFRMQKRKKKRRRPEMNLIALFAYYILIDTCCCVCLMMLLI